MNIVLLYGLTQSIRGVIHTVEQFDADDAWMMVLDHSPVESSIVVTVNNSKIHPEHYDAMIIAYSAIVYLKIAIQEDDIVHVHYDYRQGD